MKKRIIHVNQHVIKLNRKNNNNARPLTCKTYNQNEYAYDVELTRPGHGVYSPRKPVYWGAKVRIETCTTSMYDV